MTAIIDGTNGVTTPNVLTSSSGVALTLQSGGTTAVTIDTSQQVGIGTASPSNPLHVVGSIRTSSGSNYAQFSNNFLRSNASGSFFYDNATVGQSNEFRTSVSSSLDTTALTLTASGILALRNAATNATGIGITFPATQSASSDANTLDDYEEGTWTPIFYGSNGSTSFGYVTQVGYYTKIGNLVYITFRIGLSSISGAGGSLYVKGMPFNNASTTNNFGVLSVGYQSGFTTAGPTYGRSTYNNQFIELYYIASLITETIVQTSYASSTCQLIGSMVYQTS